MNPFERANRLAKAMKIVAAIDRELARDRVGLSDEAAAATNAGMPPLLRTMSTEWWAHLAATAGVHPPSKATIELVVAIFEQRVARAS